MGAPWWAKKDVGAWTVPKGGIKEGDEPFQTAKREFTEELGIQVPDGPFTDLGAIEQNNNKTVQAWAVEAEPDISAIKSNVFKAEWPPRSGNMQEFPEVDKAAWMSLAEAARKSVSGQAGLFEKLANILHVSFGAEEIPEPPAQSSLF
jgi:predicted NUDIX family NTP pyrophosphohydrolase